MPQAPSATPNRHERRRARSRQALVGAARAILAERGHTEVSIQEIADRADVGFGTFYNYFSTKSDLFDAAVTDALEEHGRLLDGVTAGLDDPAETLAVSLRLSIRLAPVHPELTRILCLRGLSQIHVPTGLGPRALRDLLEGRSRGRFHFENPQVALSAVGGALLGLLQLSTTCRLEPDAGDQLAELVLRMLRVPDTEAHEVAHRALPELG
ncbi:TetR/AcrR family transcriptional regulator [Streptomyces sp. NPDC091272]|uniref:TetR/AcrR family transcriptional regulator n=1 Tax=Streptomyces sp. NPDC091272 TaxID=3365981 RepID=UPI0038036DCE